ncbi:hypothetical protein ADICYQ_0170 [Cyclobacterium qasimii M12-11B]|uniref:Uncharacterized protein n=1 Tax=Cyclobacterium qasimii M12-11B TaxID=641524 RepID=S7WY80_9BACT|nr:hypothetical protein ADICYQ_0170 [Cyclobacterium qasimii M12-11B]
MTLLVLVLVGCSGEQVSTNDQLQFDVEIDTMMVNPRHD